MIRFALLLGVSWIVALSSCQNFDTNLNDKEYLDRIQGRLREQVEEAHLELVNQTKILQQVTRAFIESKIKENLFKAVRARVEAELEEMTANNATTLPSSRQARQEEEDDEETTTPRPLARPQSGLLPQLANVVTTLFGSDVNVTNYIKDATSFLPPDLSKRFVVAASLIDPGRFASTSTLPPLIINGQVISQEAILNGSSLGLPVVQGGIGINPSQAGGVQQGVVQQTFTPSQQKQVASNPVGTISVSGAQVPPQQPQHLTNAQRVGSTPLSPNHLSLPVNLQETTFGNPQNQQQFPVSNFGQQQHEQQIGLSQISAQQQQQQQHQQHLLLQQQQQIASQNLLGGSNTAAGILPGAVNGQFILPPPQQQLLSPNGFLPINRVPVTTNEIFNSVNLSPTTTLATANVPLTSNENEDYETSGEDEASSNFGPDSFIPKDPLDELNSSNEAENDLPVESFGSENKTRPSGKQDRPKNPDGYYLDEYPAVQYAIKLFNRLTSSQTEIPTTTEFMNITSTVKTLDSLEEEEAVATSPSTPTVSRLVQGGVYLYEGAREAYHLLQHINKFLDKVNVRLENAGYGAEDIGINIEERKE